MKENPALLQAINTLNQSVSQLKESVQSINASVPPSSNKDVDKDVDKVDDVINHQSQQGHFDYNEDTSTLTWIDNNPNNPFHNLNIPVNDYNTNQLGEYTLIMDSFITADIKYRSKRDGIWVTSLGFPHPVNTTRLTHVAWFVLFKYPLFIEIYHKYVSKNFNNVVTTYAVENNSQWSQLNYALNRTIKITYEQWINHWIEGIRRLADMPYTVEELTAFEFKLYFTVESKRRFIKPLQPSQNPNPLIGSLDIETVTLSNGELIPYAIGFCLSNLEHPESKIRKTYYILDYLEDTQDFKIASTGGAHPPVACPPPAG